MSNRGVFTTGQIVQKANIKRFQFLFSLIMAYFVTLFNNETRMNNWESKQCFLIAMFQIGFLALWSVLRTSPSPQPSSIYYAITFGVQRILSHYTQSFKDNRKCCNQLTLSRSINNNNNNNNKLTTK